MEIDGRRAARIYRDVDFDEMAKAPPVKTWSATHLPYSGCVASVPEKEIDQDQDLRRLAEQICGRSEE